MAEATTCWTHSRRLNSGWHSTHRDCPTDQADWCASPFAFDCRTTREPLLFPCTVDRPASWSPRWLVSDSGWMPFPGPREPRSRWRSASCDGVQSFRVWSSDCWAPCCQTCWKHNNFYLSNKIFEIGPDIFQCWRERTFGTVTHPPGFAMLLSASSSHFCSNGFNLHIFLKLRFSASNREMVVWEKSFP